MGFEASYKNIGFGSFANIYTPSYSYGGYFGRSFSLPSLFSGFSSGWNYSSYLPFSSFSTRYSSYGVNDYSPSSFSYAPAETSYKPAYYSQSYEVSSKTSKSSFGSLTSSPLSRNYSYRAVSSKTQQKLGPEFLARVKQVAKSINCDYKDLLAVMNSESGLNPAIQNTAGYQAYGLIQFTPSTAAELGTTVDKLVKMSAVKQLDYVEKFYLNARKTRGFGNKKFTAADLYAITFLPARANRNLLCVEGERWESGRKKGQLKNWYEANKVFDKNRDGKIEKWELQQQMDTCRVNENIFVA